MTPKTGFSVNLRENPVSKIKKFKELSNPDGSDEIKNHVLSAPEETKRHYRNQ
jgi:hypothetical protein